jgi:hypothetical protein
LGFETRQKIRRIPQRFFRDKAQGEEYESYQSVGSKPPLMPRLVISPGTPQAWEIQLKPGINFLGRGPSNDFKIDDLSISGAHCQVIVANDSVTIRDMGSTNGTFVNRAKVQESRLAAGQPLRLGSVDMIFYGDEAAPVNVTTAPPPPPIAPALRATPLPVSPPPLAPVPAMKVSDAPPAPSPAPGLRITGLTQAPASALVADSPTLEPATIAPAAPSSNVIDVGRRFCKFHPQSPARYLCNKCNRTFCELCVTSLNIGGKTKKNCRGCGVECVQVQVHAVLAGPQKGFFAMVPGAFVYPMRGSGIFILLVGMIIFAGIRLGTLMMQTGNIRNIGMGIILQIILGGYLFTFLQNIIHSTAAGDEEVPELPGINFLEDILMPFLRVLGLFLVCFAPAIAFVVLAFATATPSLAIGILPATLFGCIYFPMAFLAVAILDSVSAVNPLVIIPSILKVPLEYLVVVAVLVGMLVFTQVGDILMKYLFPRGMMTESIPELLAMFGMKFLWSLVGVYLLIVKTRVLGLLYWCKKGKLGWIGG